MMNSFYKALFPVAFACCTLAFVACSDDGSDFLQAPYGKAGPVVPDSSDDVSSSSARGASSSSLASSSSVGSSSSLIESYVKGSSFNAFTDKRDGNVYRVAVIGSQVWMAENLRYRDKVATPSLEGHSWSIADDCASSGCLYDFSAVMDNPECADSFCIVENPHRGICPEGFHVPTEGEWKVMLAEASDQGVSLNDSAGFSSAPTGEFAGYVRSDECARFWTATQSNSDGAYEYYRCREETTFRGQSYTKFFGYALRCVADAGEVKLDKFVEVPTPSSSSVSSSSSEESSSSSVESSSSEEISSSSVESSSEESSSSEVSSSSVTLDGLKTITDVRDGEVYRVMKVGTQVWMAENLRYTDSIATRVLQGATFCWQDDPENCKTRGALYLWHAAMGKESTECGFGYWCDAESPARGICPEGFRVPTSSEWYDLRQYASDSEKELFDIPTGEVDTRYDKSFASESAAHYWTSSEVNAQGAVTWYISNHDISSQDFDKRMGYALRCVKDAE